MKSEIPSVKAKLDSVRRNGMLICESTKSEKERHIVKGSIRSLEDQMSKVESWLYEREHEVKEAVNALNQFLESHSIVEKWIQKVDAYLCEESDIQSLQDAKKKLSNLQVCVFKF